MDATMAAHVLQKLDMIREDQIRELERVDEIREILRARPSEAPAPMAALPVEPAVKLFSMNSVMWLSRFLIKHGPILLTILYMKATGQDEKILIYVNGLLGI